MDKRALLVISGLAGLAGGVLAAMLLTPKSGKETREWIADQTKGSRDWIENKGHVIKEEGGKKIDRFSKGIRKTLDENLPDLYKATEEMTFETDEGA